MTSWRNHDYKQAQRQHHRPIRTHHETRNGWFLAIAIGCVYAALFVWGLS